MANITLNWKIPVGLTWVYSIENGDECTATSTSKYLLYQLTNDNIVITARKQVESGNKVILTNNITGQQLIFTLGEKQEASQVDPVDPSISETTTIYWGGTNDYQGPATSTRPNAQPIPADFDYKHLGHSGTTTGTIYSNTIEAGHKIQWVAMPIDWGIYIFKEDGMNTDALDDGNSYAVTMEDGEYQVVATKDYGTGSLVQEVTTSFTVKKGISNNFK